MHRGDWKAGNLGPLVGKQRGFKTRARERGGVEIVPGKGKQKSKEAKEVLPAKNTTEQAGIVPPKMRKGQARMPTSPSPLSPTNAFAKLSLTSPILRTEDSTISTLTSDVLTSPVPPALSRRRQKSPSTSDAMSKESFDVMTVDSPPTATRSSDVPMSDARPLPPLPRRKPAKKSSSTPPINEIPPPPRVDNDRSTVVDVPRRPSLPKRRPRVKESPDSTPDTPPLETPDGMLVDLPLPTPNILVVAPSVMSPGKKRKEPDTEPPTRFKSPSPVMRTPSPDIPGLFLVSPKTPPSYNPPASFPSPASPTIRSQLFSHSHSPPSPPSPPRVSKSLPERNLNSPQKRRKMTLDDWKKEREKTKVGVVKREEEEPSLRMTSIPIPIPVLRAPRAMTIPDAPRAPRAMMGGWGVLGFYC